MTKLFAFEPGQPTVTHLSFPSSDKIATYLKENFKCDLGKDAQLEICTAIGRLFADTVKRPDYIDMDVHWELAALAKDRNWNSTVVANTGRNLISFLKNFGSQVPADSTK